MRDWRFWARCLECSDFTNKVILFMKKGDIQPQSSVGISPAFYFLYQPNLFYTNNKIFTIIFYEFISFNILLIFKPKVQIESHYPFHLVMS